MRALVLSLSLLLPACGGTVAPSDPDAGSCVAQQVTCLRARIHTVSDVDAASQDCEHGWEVCVGEVSR